MKKTNYKVTISDDSTNNEYVVTITKDSLREAIANNDVMNLMYYIFFKIMKLEEIK